MVYGAMYSGVPTFMRSLKANRDFTAKPKSDIFHLLPTLRMFAGFRSL